MSLRWVMEHDSDMVLIDEAGAEVLRVELWSFTIDPRRGSVERVTVRTPDRGTDVEVYVSPKGRNVRTFVKGKEVHW